MNSILWRATLLLLLSVGLLKGQDPRWGFLGDDGALEAAFDEAKGVVFVCVFETELRDVRPPFAEVVYHATVIESRVSSMLERRSRSVLGLIVCRRLRASAVNLWRRRTSGVRVP